MSGCSTVHFMWRDVYLVAYDHISSHLISRDYWPLGMYHSDPGLQSIQLDWSKGMLVRVQTVLFDNLNSWYVMELWLYHCWLESTIGHSSNLCEEKYVNAAKWNFCVWNEVPSGRCKRKKACESGERNLFLCVWNEVPSGRCKRKKKEERSICVCAFSKSSNLQYTS